MRSRRLLLFAICLLLCLVAAPSALGEDTVSAKVLGKRIDEILEKHGPDASKWAIEVVSLDSGKVLYGRNAESAMIPASNVKLFTAAAALFYLGPDFTTRTSVCFGGELGDGGVLNGDLILYGRGDPNISGRFTDSPTAIFEEFAGSLKALGLREVRGDVVGDDSYFDSEYFGPWPEKDSRKWYAARVSALSFNDNCIDIYLWPGQSAGARAKVACSPATSYARLVNRATTTNRKHNSVWVSPGTNDSTIVVGGSVWSGKKEQILYYAVDSPALYAATVFKETLEREGIPVSGKARGLASPGRSAVPPGAVAVVEHESQPLSEMIKVVNKRSQNLHAELILKQLGLHAGNGPTFEGGIEAVRKFLAKAGINSEAVQIYDGSGLSRSNRASAHAIVELLKFMDQSKWRDVFRESLAVAGVDDSLKSMSKSVAPEAIRGKTGSLKGVLAFSGYADGTWERLAFAIVVNDGEGKPYELRQIRDRICKELAEF